MSQKFHHLLERLRIFQEIQVLFTAHRLGIFDAIGQEPLLPEQIAKHIAASELGTIRLLDALSGLGVLRKRNSSYAHTDLSWSYLCRAGPHYRGATLDHLAELHQTWSLLDHAIRTGQSVRHPENSLIQDPAHNRRFIAAMADIGKQWAPLIANHLDLSPYSHLLDLGGGPGVYALEFLRHNPKLKAVLADLPITLAAAQELLAEEEHKDRLSLLPVDFYDPQADIGSGYDLVLISNVLHVEGQIENQRLLQKVYQAMVTKGLLLIHEAIIEPCRIAPIDRALFALNMLLNTERGNCYTFEEIATWLTAAGFKDIRLEPCCDQPSLIAADK